MKIKKVTMKNLRIQVSSGKPPLQNRILRLEHAQAHRLSAAQVDQPSETLWGKKVQMDWTNEKNSSLGKIGFKILKNIKLGFAVVITCPYLSIFRTSSSPLGHLFQCSSNSVPSFSTPQYTGQRDHSTSEVIIQISDA